MEREHEGAGPATTGHQEQQRKEEHEALREEGQRIYVASLGDYKRRHFARHLGSTPGKNSTDCRTRSTPCWRARQAGTPKSSPSNDYEGFGPYHVNEYVPLGRLSQVARGIRQHGPAFGAWAERCDDDAHGAVRGCLPRGLDGSLEDYGRRSRGLAWTAKRHSTSTSLTACSPT